MSFGQGEKASVSVRIVPQHRRRRRPAGQASPYAAASTIQVTSPRPGATRAAGSCAPPRILPQRVALVGAEHEEDHVPRGVERREGQRQPAGAVRRGGRHAAALLLVAGVVAGEQAGRVAVGAHAEQHQVEVLRQQLRVPVAGGSRGRRRRPPSGTRSRAGWARGRAAPGGSSRSSSRDGWAAPRARRRSRSRARASPSGRGSRRTRAGRTAPSASLPPARATVCGAERREQVGSRPDRKLGRGVHRETHRLGHGRSLTSSAPAIAAKAA